MVHPLFLVSDQINLVPHFEVLVCEEFLRHPYILQDTQYGVSLVIGLRVRNISDMYQQVSMVNLFECSLEGLHKTVREIRDEPHCIQHQAHLSTGHAEPLMSSI